MDPKPSNPPPLLDSVSDFLRYQCDRIDSAFGIVRGSVENIEPNVKSEEAGPELRDCFADFCHWGMSGQVTFAKEAEEIRYRYRRPVNCSLMVPRVNVEVWKRMSRADRDRDLELRKMQRDLLSLVNVLLVTQNSSACAPTFSRNLDDLNDCMFCMLCEMCKQVTLVRQKAVRTAVEEDFTILDFSAGLTCSWLFSRVARRRRPPYSPPVNRSPRYQPYTPPTGSETKSYSESYKEGF